MSYFTSLMRQSGLGPASEGSGRGLSVPERRSEPRSPFEERTPDLLFPDGGTRSPVEGEGEGLLFQEEQTERGASPEGRRESPDRAEHRGGAYSDRSWREQPAAGSARSEQSIDVTPPRRSGEPSFGEEGSPASLSQNRTFSPGVDGGAGIGASRRVSLPERGDSVQDRPSGESSPFPFAEESASKRGGPERRGKAPAELGPEGERSHGKRGYPFGEERPGSSSPGRSGEGSGNSGRRDPLLPEEPANPEGSGFGESRRAVRNEVRGLPSGREEARRRAEDLRYLSDPAVRNAPSDAISERSREPGIRRIEREEPGDYFSRRRSREGDPSGDRESRRPSPVQEAGDERGGRGADEVLAARPPQPARKEESFHLSIGKIELIIEEPRLNMQSMPPAPRTAAESPRRTGDEDRWGRYYIRI